MFKHTPNKPKRLPEPSIQSTCKMCKLTTTFPSSPPKQKGLRKNGKTKPSIKNRNTPFQYKGSSQNRRETCLLHAYASGCQVPRYPPKPVADDGDAQGIGMSIKCPNEPVLREEREGVGGGKTSTGKRGGPGTEAPTRRLAGACAEP